LAVAPPARADVGDVSVQQQNADGQTVSTQDYVVANLAPETIGDPVTQGATTVTITNDTLEPINVTAASGDPEIPPGQSLKIEICMSAGFCMTILEVVLPDGV
jgi:hypothetical protein